MTRNSVHVKHLYKMNSEYHSYLSQFIYWLFFLLSVVLLYMIIIVFYEQDPTSVDKLKACHYHNSEHNT